MSRTLIISLGLTLLAVGGVAILLPASHEQNEKAVNAQPVQAPSANSNNIIINKDVAVPSERLPAAPAGSQRQGSAGSASSPAPIHVQPRQATQRTSEKSADRTEPSAAATMPPDERQATFDTPLRLNLSDMTNNITDPYLKRMVEESQSMLEPDQLVMLIKSEEPPQETKKQAMQAILAWAALPDNKPAQVYQKLVEIKDSMGKEDQQFILKELSRYGDFGSNDAIVDSFDQAAKRGELEINRMRMLTYLDPTYPLAPKGVATLSAAYADPQYTEIRPTILNAVATSGGDAGLSWLVDQVAATGDYAEWTLMVDTLGRSNSRNVKEYLHEELHGLVPLGPEYEVNRERLRNAILRLNESTTGTGN